MRIAVRQSLVEDDPLHSSTVTDGAVLVEEEGEEEGEAGAPLPPSMAALLSSDRCFARLARVYPLQFIAGESLS